MTSMDNAGIVIAIAVVAVALGVWRPPGAFREAIVIIFPQMERAASTATAPGRHPRHDEHPGH